MSLRQKKYTAFAVMLGVPALLVLMVTGLEDIWTDTHDIAVAILILAEIAGFALHLYWMRCPHCGEHLDRNYGQYCQHCGEEIDWDAKPGGKED